jgi:hypothetical protein
MSGGDPSLSGARHRERGHCETLPSDDLETGDPQSRETLGFGEEQEPPMDHWFARNAGISVGPLYAVNSFETDEKQSSREA